MKEKLCKTKLKKDGHIMRPFVNWYLVDRSYLQIEYSIIGKIVGVLWIILVLPFIFLVVGLLILGSLGEWLSDRVDVVPSWGISPLSKAEIVRVEGNIKHWEAMVKK